MRGQYFQFVCFSLALPLSTLAMIEHFYNQTYKDIKYIANVSTRLNMCDNILATGLLDADAYLFRSDNSVHTNICEFFNTQEARLVDESGKGWSRIVDDHEECNVGTCDNNGCCSGFQCISIGSGNDRQRICQQAGSTLINAFIGGPNQKEITVKSEEKCSKCPSNYKSFSYDTKSSQCYQWNEITIIEEYPGYEASKCADSS